MSGLVVFVIVGLGVFVGKKIMDSYEWFKFCGWSVDLYDSCDGDCCCSRSCSVVDLVC